MKKKEIKINMDRTPWIMFQKSKKNYLLNQDRNSTIKNFSWLKITSKDSSTGKN